MRSSSVPLTSLALAALLTVACSDSASRESPRSVLLISIDSLRADHLGCYGYARPTSPRLDALAAEGVRFARALAPSPWTLPSHASLFTGLYPMTHGVEESGLRLRESTTTLAKELGAAGFATHAIVCAPLLRPEFGLDAGFQGYDTSLVGETPEDARALKVAPGVTDRALRWLDRVSGRPFFLFLHYWDVHYDYTPPADLVEEFDPGYAGTLEGTGIHDRDDLVPSMDPRDLEHLRALYDGEIRYTDRELGRLLDGVAARGLAETTLVWVVADHGEEFLDHGGTGHTSTCYGEVLDVPMLLRAPWLGSGGRVLDAPVSLVDVLPTTLELLGLPPARTPLQGLSLAGLVRGDGSLPERALLAETLRGRPPVASGKAARRWTEGPALRWSLLQTASGEGLHLLSRAGRTRRTLLFDRSTDPAEQLDLAAQDAARTERLTAELRLAFSEAEDLGEVLGASESWKPEEAMIETLRGLGYVR